MRCFGPQISFYAIWNKGFLDHAYLTDGMQWLKSKKHIYISSTAAVLPMRQRTLTLMSESENIYILMHFILWMCSVRVNAALDSQRLERACSCNENVMRKYRSFYNFNPCNLFFKQRKSCLSKDMINHHHPSIELIILSFLNTSTQKNMIQF